MAMAHKGLAKLAEELGELSQVVGKKLAYPDVDIHPDGNDLNVKMEEEIADVIAAIDFVVNKHGLDEKKIIERSLKKRNRFLEWDKEN